MSYDYAQLDNISRLFVEAELKVPGFGGGRFQPTNFPDLGPALYKGADGKQWLIVESPQSMANRMERVCWIDGDGETDRVGRYNADCQGIPYVLAITGDGLPLTASPLEAHRLASPYLWDSWVVEKTMKESPADKQEKNPSTSAANANPSGVEISLADKLEQDFSLHENRLVPWKKIAYELLQIDPGCLLHGVWLSGFFGGRVRLTRSLSGYIEAENPMPANFGFQKRDPVSSGTDKDAGQTASEGFGSVIGPKQHFASSKVKACFQLDLDRLRSYGLSNVEVRALAAWGIYKIRRVLTASRDGVADLRTECKFEALEPTCEAVQTDGKKTKGFLLPELADDLTAAFASLNRFEGEGEKKVPKLIRVRWVPKIEGKSELPQGLADSNINLAGVESKAKIEPRTPKATKKNPKPETKRLLVLYGEWTTGDKKKLRDQNIAREGEEKSAKAADTVEKAIKDYERNWAAKAQGAKPKDEESDEADVNQTA